MTRLFTFGCSFTNYVWPTWADIMSRDFDEFYNYGQIGAGNQFIFNSLIEANLLHQFDKQDTIAIMWTNVSREDRYVKNRWVCPGNIYTQPIYDKKFVRKFADDRGYYIRDLATIWATNQILEHTQCRFIQFSMVDMINPAQYEHQDASEMIKDLLPYYQPVLKNILPSVHKVIFDYNWNSRPNKIPLSLSRGPTRFVTQHLENQDWKIWYNNIKDPTWPDCVSEEDFDFLPAHIQQECREHFGYRPGFKTHKKPSFWKRTKELIKDKIRPLSLRADIHPTTAEHLEYLNCVLPDFTVSDQTQNWVNSVESALHAGQNHTKLWTPNKPTRW